jgi:esterase/lipase superfamily enzyme
MLRWLILVLTLAFGEILALAQDPSNPDERMPTAHSSALDLSLPKSTEISITVDEPLSSKNLKPGQLFTATISFPVLSVDGTVAIPAGTRLAFEIVGLKNDDFQQNGRLLFRLKGVLVRGQVVPVKVASMRPEEKGAAIGSILGGRVGRDEIKGALSGSKTKPDVVSVPDLPKGFPLALVVNSFEISPRGFRRVHIYFATDRRQTGTVDAHSFYGSERNEDLSYGTCDVSIPLDHHVGHLESPFFFEFHPKPENNVLLLQLKSISRDDFLSQVSIAANASNKEILVFIHGYNVTFEDAARRTAQLVYDLQFKGVPMLYSWPSRGRWMAYSADEASARWSAYHLKAFLQDIATKTAATTIHVIAHSLGNRALSSALEKISYEHSIPRTRLREIVLAAPDIDLGEFQQLSGALSSSAQHVTIYSSNGDWALAASRIIHSAMAVGAAPPSVSRSLAVLGLDFIDASFVKGDILDHSYFSTRMVLDDMGYVIREHIPPSRRQGLAPAPPKSPSYWIFRK